MNKKIILIIFVLLVIAVLISLSVIFIRNNNIQNEDIPIQKEELFYTGNTAAEGMEPINKDIVLGDVLQNVKDDSVSQLVPVSDEEANQLINLGDYIGLEKRVAKYESEDEYTEIWLFKLSEASQGLKLSRLFEHRLDRLKEQYKDNERLSEIFNNTDSVVRKQQQDIAIVIISNKADDVEQAINKAFIK